MAPPAWAYIDFSQPSLWLCIGSILFNRGLFSCSLSGAALPSSLTASLPNCRAHVIVPGLPPSPSFPGNTATFWNLVARNEHQRHTIERTVGSPYLGCYLLAVTIFSLGILRDSIYHDALAHQPQLPFLGASCSALMLCDTNAHWEETLSLQAMESSRVWL